MKSPQIKLTKVDFQACSDAIHLLYSQRKYSSILEKQENIR